MTPPAPPRTPAAEIVVELPLPDRCLHPNHATSNGFARSRARQEARRMAYVRTVEAMGALARPQPWYSVRWQGVRASVTFRGVRRDQDRDNAEGWLKATRDGIADALCGGQDHEWVWEGEPRYEKGAAGMTIVVWPHDARAREE